MCTALGIALAVSAASYIYVTKDGEYKNEVNEQLVYAELNEDIHRKFGGFDIDELCEGYDPPKSFLGQTEIPMEVVNQYPELPVGCEITCAAAMLNFFGYDVEKCYLADNYLPVSSEFTEKDGKLFGPDPRKVFVGDPYGRGYGCYEDVIAAVLDDYFSSHDSKNRAVILEDANSADLERLLDRGVPLIVWASIDMKPYKYNKVSEWQTEDGDTIMWLSNSHTLILTGYDGAFYFFMDCSDKTEIQRYPKETFLSRWKENGSQCIAVKIND